MAKHTYDEALAHVFVDEGGYSNDVGDDGGPTRYGITIHDAHAYWKANATAADVRKLPISVARDIYRKRYADPLQYDQLPAGVDYCVLDYGINSGISRAAKILQRIVGAKVDGLIGPVTLAATAKMDPNAIIDAMCDERMKFLRGLSIFGRFGKGWTRRVTGVRSTSHHLTD